MKITPDAFAVLTDLDDGEFQREVDDAFAEVIEAARELLGPDLAPSLYRATA